LLREEESWLQKILPIEGKKDAKGQKMGRFGAENSAHRG